MPDHFTSRESAETDLLSAATYIAERIKSHDGHAEAMNSIVPLYLAKNNVDFAAELANSVEDPFSRDKLLTLVAEKCAELDDDEYAMQLADAIEDHGIQAQAFERIGLVKAGKGQAEKAAGVADAMAHPDFVLAAVAVNQASTGDSAAAAVTLEQIEYATAKVSALQQMAGIALENKDPESALAYLAEASEAAADIEHDEEKIRVLCEIGNAYIEAKRNDKAVEILDTAREHAEQLDNLHRDLFLASCAVGFLHAGSSELADRTLDLVADKTNMSSAMVAFAREDWKKEAKDEAVETLEEAFAILRSQRESETRDSRSRNALLASIATQFAGFGKTERGIEVALENPNPTDQTEALAQIARILTVQKEDDLARGAINEIEEDADRLAALVGVADTKLKQGEAEASLAILEEAASMAGSVQQLASRSGVLSELAARFAVQGQVERARELSIDNLAVISEIRDDSSQAALLAGISLIFDGASIELGDREKQQILEMVRRVEFS